MKDLTDVIWDQPKKDEILNIFGHIIFVNFWLILDNKKTGDVYTMFFGEMDAIDNSEPFIPGFVRSNVEELMEKGGFKMDKYDPDKFILAGRVGFKPIN